LEVGSVIISDELCQEDRRYRIEKAS